jgi:hypothetical protein
MVTKEQIEARLKALSDYELSLVLNTWDEPDSINDELLRVLHARSKLIATLKEFADGN